jgi:hypothetical protein
MQKIYCEKVKGFKVKVDGCNTIEVYDSRLKPFYVKPTNGKDTFFNLPIGIYFTDCELIQLKEPVRYNVPKLARFEKNIKEPKKIGLFFGNNPNKCTIDIKTGNVLLDYKFRNETRPQIEFILNHERGHYKYFNESMCDLFSVCEMIKKGYNPSQMVFGINACLSDYSKKRKLILHNFVKKITQI